MTQNEIQLNKEEMQNVYRKVRVHTDSHVSDNYNMNLS